MLFRRRSLEETLEETHPGKSLNGGQTGPVTLEIPKEFWKIDANTSHVAFWDFKKKVAMNRKNSGCSLIVSHHNHLQVESHAIPYQC